MADDGDPTTDEEGLERKLIPLSELTPAERELLLEQIEKIKKEEEENIEIGTNGGTSLGHISKSHSYTTFTNIPADTEMKVYSNKYDINEGIPTSEYITVYGKAPKALYNIVVRKTTIRAWNDPVVIQAHASYSYNCHHYRTRGSGKNKRSYCYYHHEAIGSVTKNTAYTAYTASRQQTYYDVVTSDIYRLESMTITETNEIYSKYKLDTTLSMSGISGPGPQTLSFPLQRPNISSSYNRDDEGYYGWSRGAASSAAAGSSGSAGKSAVISALNTAINASVRGSVDYSWAGLRVTKTSMSGSPNPGYSEVTGEILIPETYPNGRYAPNWDCYFYYSGYGRVSSVPDDVYVHTPVVNKAKITNTSDFINQKIGADTTKNNYYLMLDEEFTITIPDSGTHRNIKNYGTRKYNSKQGDNRQGNKSTTWGKWEEVKFPFDIYVNGNSGKKYFLPANQWMSAQSWWNTALSDITKWSGGVGTQYTFTIPVWVTEKTYSGGEGKSIEVRVVAENAFGNPSIDAVNHLNETDNKQIGEANTDITKYVATQYIDCEVIGKIYDLRVSGSNDPGWQDKIYNWNDDGKNYIRAQYFPFGQLKQNKVTQYKYAPKLGYTFVFDFKTKGRKSNEIEATILPKMSASGFYYVSKDATNGTKIQEVDLYYHSTAKRYEKIETGDPASISVKLAEAYLKVPSQEFVDSNRVYKKELNKVYNYNLGVSIGNFTKLIMPHSLRLAYDNFAEYIGKLYGTNATKASITDNAKVDGATRNLSDGTDNVIGSVGHWYAGYRLPNTTMALPKGADLNNAIKNNSFLKNGFILVKMDLKTAYNVGTNSWEYLQYTGPEAINEITGETTGELVKDELGNPEDWTNPALTDPITLPNGVTVYGPHGTMVIFDADLRASNDAEVAGTH